MSSEMFKALTRSKDEQERNAAEINKFKEQYAQWINEFGDDIKNGNTEEIKKENFFVKFLKKLFNTLSYG